jgi:hypothetical protein
MSSVDAKRRAAENLLAEAAEEELLLEKLGTNEDYPNDTVLCWTRQFATGGIRYTYVAVKINGRWYITGNQSRSTYNWEQLVNTQLRYADDICIATEWEGI